MNVTRVGALKTIFFFLATSVLALPGDVNLNSQIDSGDLTLLESHLLAIDTLSGQALQNADVNLDSEVDVADYLLLGVRISNPTPSPTPSASPSPTPSTDETSTGRR